MKKIIIVLLLLLLFLPFLNKAEAIKDVSTLELIIIIALFVLLPFMILAIFPALFIILMKIPSPLSIYKAIYTPIANLYKQIKAFFIIKLNSKQAEIVNKVILNPMELPQTILHSLNISDFGDILFACRLSPLSTLKRNGKKKLNSLLLMTKDYVYLLGYIACRDKCEDIESVPLANIQNIDANTEEGKFMKKPFISINTADNIQYKFFFYPIKISKIIMYKILSTFKETLNEIQITCDIPEDFRSDSFKDFDDGVKDFNKQMKEEMTKDLKDIFK